MHSSSKPRVAGRVRALMRRKRCSSACLILNGLPSWNGGLFFGKAAPVPVEFESVEPPTLSVALVRMTVGLRLKIFTRAQRPDFQSGAAIRGDCRFVEPSNPVDPGRVQFLLDSRCHVGGESLAARGGGFLFDLLSSRFHAFTPFSSARDQGFGRAYEFCPKRVPARSPVV